MGLVNVYAYDGKNRLASIAVQTSSGQSFLPGTITFGYDAMDRRTSLAYPNGTKTNYQYDDAYRLTAIATKNAVGNVIDAWSYAYDAVGNRTSKTDMDGRTETYRYDSVYRLTDADYGDGTRESFSYDNVGNRMSRIDETGTRTTYSYDVANQMLAAGADTYTYDGNGNVLTKTSPSPGAAAKVTMFTYDGAQSLNSVTAVTTDNASAVYRTQYKAFGQAKTTRYGATATSFAASRLGYTSRENSLGSLMQYRARYYDTSVGRFPAPDGYRTKRPRRQTTQQYGYVSNNPARFTDPSGQREWELSYMSFSAQYPNFSPAMGVVMWSASPLDYWKSEYSDVAGIALWYGAALGVWFFSGSTSSVVADQPNSLAPGAGWDGAFAYASASIVPGYGVGITMMLFNAGAKDAIIAQTNLYETGSPSSSGPGSAWTIGFDIGISVGVGYSVSYE
jgi:RHS repeat-associated protein